MGSVGNQNPWTPYYSYKDCSLGLCSIYCPQFCYFIFPPPPPPDDDDDATPFSPLIIAVIGVLASAFILVSYYTIVTRYCKRGSQGMGLEDENEGGHDQWQGAASASAGLDEAIIKTITVCTYRKGEGLIEGTECAVCLSEFQEDEPLRLLPKCSHAFHLPCIDTWLKSHSNCPLCRAGVVPPAPSSQASGADLYEIRRPDDLVLVVVDDRGLECCEEVVVSVDEGDSTAKSRGSVGEFRRSVSLGAFPSHCGFMDEDLRVEKDQSGAMKRSSSTGRFMFFDHVKGKSFIVPH